MLLYAAIMATLKPATPRVDETLAAFATVTREVLQGLLADAGPVTTRDMTVWRKVFPAKVDTVEEILDVFGSPIDALEGVLAEECYRAAILKAGHDVHATIAALARVLAAATCTNAVAA